MRNLADRHLVWILAEDSIGFVIEHPYIGGFCSEWAVLDLICLEYIETDEFVETPDSNRAIKTGWYETWITVFDKFHRCDSTIVALVGVH